MLGNNKDTRFNRSLSVMLPNDIPIQLNNREVRSATQYLIMAHLMRPLVHRNREAQLEGNLAESWEITNSYSTFIFKISKNAFWSNGEPITAGQVSAWIQEQIKVGSTTHFDFRTIDSVEASDNRLTIRLKEPNPTFLAQLVHPEFGPVYPSQISVQNPGYQITAGAYFIAGRTANEVVLEKNGNYPFTKPTAPKEVRLKSVASADDQLAGLRARTVDVVIPMNGVTPEKFATIKMDQDIQTIDTRVGYTFWIAPNWQSPQFKGLAERRWLSSKLGAMQIDFEPHQPYWNSARQIYLNDGFGRPTQSELNDVWRKINQGAGHRPSALVFLVSAQFPFTNEIVKALASENVPVQLDIYRDLTEFEAKVHKGEFDLMQINNDFSSYDVLENLSVTFSSSRPLIAVGKELSRFQQLLSRARQVEEKEGKHELLKKIGLQLLEEGAAIPIAYRKNIILATNDWDFSGWSNLFPDVRFWKVQPTGIASDP